MTKINITSSPKTIATAIAAGESDHVLASLEHIGVSVTVRAYWAAFCQATAVADETVTLKAAFTAAVQNVAASHPGLGLATSADPIGRAQFTMELIATVGTFPAVGQPGLAPADLSTDTGIGLKAARKATDGLTTWTAVSDALKAAKVTAGAKGKTGTQGKHAKTGSNAPKTPAAPPADPAGKTPADPKGKTPAAPVPPAAPVTVDLIPFRVMPDGTLVTDAKVLKGMTTQDLETVAHAALNVLKARKDETAAAA